MSTFSWVYKPYTFRGREAVCENQHFFHTLLTFWPDFYYFHGDFWHSVCTLLGGGLRKCMVYTLMKMLTFMGGSLSAWCESLICVDITLNDSISLRWTINSFFQVFVWILSLPFFGKTVWCRFVLQTYSFLPQTNYAPMRQKTNKY